MDSYIFLSYRSTERDFAAQLANDLKNHGLRLWMDVYEIKTGDNWNQRLSSAIDACTSIISILSPDYVTSKYCRRELLRADQRGIPIYPILLSPLADDAWPFEIQERQFISFSNWRHTDSYKTHLNSLLEVLREQFAGQFGQVPDAETQHLNNLISQLESKRGVLEYVDLNAEAEINTAMRPSLDDDEWGFPY